MEDEEEQQDEDEEQQEELPCGLQEDGVEDEDDSEDEGEWQQLQEPPPPTPPTQPSSPLPPSPPAPPNAVGARVKARYLASSKPLWQAQKWYGGVVTAAHDDGTVDVAYEDGDREERVLPQYVRPHGPPARGTAREADSRPRPSKKRPRGAGPSPSLA